MDGELGEGKGVNSCGGEAGVLVFGYCVLQDQILTYKYISFCFAKTYLLPHA